MNAVICIVRGSNHIALWLLFWTVIVYVGIQIRTMTYPEKEDRQPYVAQINMHGEISTGFTEQIRGMLTTAYDDPYAKVIILHIESEGGSPSEAWRLCTLIDQMRSLEAKNQKARGARF